MTFHSFDVPGRAGRFAALAAAGLLALGLLAGPATAQSAGPTVFAAASMKTALDEIDALWTAKSGKTVAVSYAASSALAKQIEQGAPADVFVSADIPWMDYVAQKGLIRADSRTDLLGNALVLVAPAATPDKVAIDAALAGRVGDVAPKIAGTENVRAALGLVARGEAKYGIVYATDAKSEPKVVVVATFPADSHPPIVYPAAITKDSTNPDAAAYFAFLKGPEAAAVFASQGFTVLKK